MSYCHDCEEAFERGTILCPECGSKLAKEATSAETSGWSNEGTADDSTSAWSDDAEAVDGRRDGIPTASESGSAGPSGPRYHDADIFSFSFRFPLGNGGQPFLIHSALFFVSFLLVPIPFFVGYPYRVGRAAARGDDEVPSFDDWGGIGKDGLILIGVNLAVTIGLGAVMAAVFFAMTGVGDSSSLALLIAGVGMLLVLAGSYVAGAIIPVLIGTGSVKETFSDGRVIDFALSVHYLKGFVLLVVFSLILFTAFSVVGTILIFTLIGIFLLIPLYPLLVAYTSSLAFAMWGYIYNEAAEAGDVEPVEPDAPLGLE